MMSLYRTGPLKRCVCVQPFSREGDLDYYSFVCLKIYECQEVRRRRQNKKKSGKKRNRSRKEVTHYMRVYLEGRHERNFVPFEIAEFRAYFEIVRGGHGRLLREGNMHKAPGAPVPVTDIQRETLHKTRIRLRRIWLRGIQTYRRTHIKGLTNLQSRNEGAF